MGERRSGMAVAADMRRQHALLRRVLAALLAAWLRARRFPVQAQTNQARIGLEVVAPGETQKLRFNCAAVGSKHGAATIPGGRMPAGRR